MVDRATSTIGGRARAVVAALALGAAVLGLASGNTAFAASNAANEAGDGGGGTVTPGGGTAARPKGGGSLKYCAVTLADGTIQLYEPGTTITMAGVGKVTCGKDGKWHQARSDAGSGNAVPPGGGVYAP